MRGIAESMMAPGLSAKLAEPMMPGFSGELAETAKLARTMMAPSLSAKLAEIASVKGAAGVAGLIDAKSIKELMGPTDVISSLAVSTEHFREWSLLASAEITQPVALPQLERILDEQLDSHTAGHVIDWLARLSPGRRPALFLAVTYALKELSVYLEAECHLHVPRPVVHLIPLLWALLWVLSECIRPSRACRKITYQVE